MGLELNPGPSLAVVAALLEAAGLPGSDLSDALMRSLVVRAQARGTGLGSALVARAESHARSLRLSSLYLLTTTAERFFAARGFVAADRATAPAAIRGTREFAEICPVSSALMLKRL